MLKLIIFEILQILQPILRVQIAVVVPAKSWRHATTRQTTATVSGCWGGGWVNEHLPAIRSLRVGLPGGWHTQLGGALGMCMP